MSFLNCQQITKEIGNTKILRGVSLELNEADQYVIQGSSGSGKSTLLHILEGLDRQSSGSLQIANCDISTFDDEELSSFRNSHIGFVFQFHFLLPSMSCIDNILLPAKIGGHNIKKIKQRVINLAKRLGIEKHLSKYPYELSGGEQQRVNITRALSLSPKLLLCDEPTGNLDSKNSAIVTELLQELSLAQKSTLLVVTHDGDVAKRFPHKITIEDGQIIS